MRITAHLIGRYSAVGSGFQPAAGFQPALEMPENAAWNGGGRLKACPHRWPVNCETTGMKFDQSPLLVIWETTQACDLACVHCRACAIASRDPNELTTEEAKALLDDVKRMGTPLFVLTGGDPAKRPDLVEIVRYGT